MARPTKLTEETSAAIVKALAIGATRKDAAGAAGVDYRTFLNWMEAGEKAKKGAFFQFFQACSQAEHKARLNYLSVIAKAANDGDWRAALEYLKRRDRANWGDSAAVEHSGGVRVVIVDETEKEGEDE
jgi:hypothetical protein